MLITQGADRDSLVDRKLAIALASLAGGINAGVFYAVGFFSANMTGNVSTLSDRLATGEVGGAWVYLAIVGAFVGGAAFCGIMLGEAERRALNGAHAYIVLLEGVLLAPMAFVDLFAGDGLRVALLVIGLAFLMGLQNAVVTHLSSARVRTTHISGMATDLGIQLALAWRLRGRRDQYAEANIARLRLHLSTIGAFLLGGIAGVLVYKAIGGYGFSLAGVILAAVGVQNIIRARQRRGY